MASATIESSSPSTSPSPPRTPRKNKRKSDPFLELPNTPTGDGTNDQSRSNGDRQNQNESTLTKIIMTPLLFTSFLLSLLLVDHRYRAWRTSEHPNSNTPSSFWSRISLRNWLDPEPYQDPSNTTWQHAQDGKGHLPDQYREKWFMRKKHRKMTKLEVGEAFEMSGRIMVVVGGAFVFGALGIGWAAQQVAYKVLW